jgi:hypothetical protein
MGRFRGRVDHVSFMFTGLQVRRNCQHQCTSVIYLRSFTNILLFWHALVNIRWRIVAGNGDLTSLNSPNELTPSGHRDEPFDVLFHDCSRRVVVWNLGVSMLQHAAVSTRTSLDHWYRYKTHVSAKTARPGPFPGGADLTTHKFGAVWHVRSGLSQEHLSDCSTLQGLRATFPIPGRAVGGALYPHLTQTTVPYLPYLPCSHSRTTTDRTFFSYTSRVIIALPLFHLFPFRVSQSQLILFSSAIHSFTVFLISLLLAYNTHILGAGSHLLPASLRGSPKRVTSILLL